MTTEMDLAIALGVAATNAGYRTLFTSAADLVASLQQAHLEGNVLDKVPHLRGALGAGGR
jgi:DNA replication protein DnaC